MKVKKITVKSFKRFTDLVINMTECDARLVVLLGQNGSGKTSIFEAMNLHDRRKTVGMIPNSVDYYIKKGSIDTSMQDLGEKGRVVNIQFHKDEIISRRAFHIRTAFRHTKEINTNQLRLNNEMAYSRQRIPTMYSEDTELIENYGRIYDLIMTELFLQKGRLDKEVIDSIIGPIREKISRLLGDLHFESVVQKDGREKGIFFSKGIVEGYSYENLSSGERAVFDLIVDLEICKRISPRSIICIDEPEAHVALNVQRNLVKEMLDCIDQDSQLWIATHSIGMLRAAMDIYKDNPNEVAFINFSNKDFDKEVILAPLNPSRRLWGEVHKISAEDLADLVLPDVIVLCESDKGFDESIYTNIFSEHYPYVNFISCGGKGVLEKVKTSLDKLQLGRRILHLRDRDRMTKEHYERENRGDKIILKRRNIEEYLIDDEVIDKFCEDKGLNIAQELKDARDSIEDHPQKDQKNISKLKAQEIYKQVNNLLKNNDYGDNFDSFYIDTMSRYIVPSSKVYLELKEVIIDRCLR